MKNKPQVQGLWARHELEVFVKIKVSWQRTRRP